ncbi:S-adenosyl-L-methionine-dependent methyltransferase [Basidiobolus meristosporus CBS 931.73]|uniref:S-adenosyl-L-methionine-dependent methyltransferase n=1 Tax=Basidiobolus meristosporus CBS 931.73 TaxID=1314790 RepID=A0A1Y1Y651_9FUNG|nr:S-adenosyl-L-methionine-dependent methyltransferase [Basidiobolus meristosporus CBS 931.73]|eukprot:ORX93186.1 S-adenosyl-L-methionine-dependent methyltransferase [Basidiobolus meristosporus CBS 931.73]
MVAISRGSINHKMPHVASNNNSLSRKEELRQLLLTLADKLTDLAEEVGDLLPDSDPDADYSQLRPSKQYFDYQSLSHGLEKVNSLLLPPYHRVMQHIGSFIEAKALHMVCRYEIPDLLHLEPMGIEAIASKTALKVDVLAALMRLLMGLGYFTEIYGPGSQVFANNAFSNILRKDHPNSARGEEWYRSMEHMPEFAQEGSTEVPFKKAYGTDVWSWFKHPENVEKRHIFEGSMVSQDCLVTCGLLEDYDWRRHSGETIVDVGSGVGAFSYKLHKRYPKLRGILLDRPEVIKDAKRVWSRDHRSLLPKVRFLGGDFFKEVPSGHEVYFMRFVLHDWDDTECHRILSVIRKAIPPHGRLLIADTIIEDPPVDRLVQQMNLLMRCLFNGQERVQEDFERILQQADFQVTKIWKLRGVVNIIEAAPA